MAFLSGVSGRTAPSLVSRFGRFLQKKQSPLAVLSAQQTFMVQPGKPVWMGRDYRRFAEEAYVKNVIAHRAIRLIAQSASTAPLKLMDRRGGGKPVKQHALLKLLAMPNPGQGGSALLEALVSYYLIHGNAYLQAAGPSAGAPRELYALRPDRVSVIAGKGAVPLGYRYTVRDANGGERHTDFPAHPETGRAAILHLKQFHPLNDWYGLSSVEAAAYSIDQHNQAGAWNQAMLQNGARPSGALVVKGETGQGGSLSEDQYYRLKRQIDDQFSGPANAGRPILLEGGLDWKEMSLSPRDMDFIQAKHSAARDIALAFGVPPQMLGIPGDNTYSNLAEARLALWEQTILPLIDMLCDALNHWLCPEFAPHLALSCDTDRISALTHRREAMWDKVNGATFLNDAEKRGMLGMGVGAVG